jgi:hypothetical protein
VAFVLSLNLKRRHLTSSQKAAVAVELLPHLEAEARDRRRYGGTAPRSPPGSCPGSPTPPATASSPPRPPPATPLRRTSSASCRPTARGQRR